MSALAMDAAAARSSGPVRGFDSGAATLSLHSAPGGGGADYFLYRCAAFERGGPVLVGVHGISRNARAHATLLGPLAAAHGAVVVAPIYDSARFPDYQRLGPRGARPDDALNRTLDDVAKRTRAEIASFRLFGYSGGAQFAQRYALLQPRRVSALALGAPGWYTYPDPGRRFPFGLQPARHLTDLRPDLEGFLDIRIRVLVGELDSARDEGLNRSRCVDQQQGATRLERAARWVNAIRVAALRMQRRSDVKLHILPGGGHDFEQNVRSALLGRRVIADLF